MTKDQALTTGEDEGSAQSQPGYGECSLASAGAEPAAAVAYSFREDGSHYNGGAVFFGYGYRAIGEPRFSMIRRWYRQGERRGKTEDRFFVDGAEVASYDVGLEALKSPPVFAPDELAALQLIGDEPDDHRNTVDFRLLRSLRDKGAIEYAKPGHCARTDAGRAAISGEQS